MLVALLLAISAQEPTFPDLDRLCLKIGRARADFGDKPNSGKWKFVLGGNFGGTYIFFPVGRADVRYYRIAGRLQGVPDRIVRTSKLHGRISLDWIVDLPDTEDRSGLRAKGTLGVLFGNRQEPLALPSKLPRTVREEFDRKQALAGYRFTGGEGGPYYFYVREDGRWSERSDNWSLDLVGRGPKTAEPYPISQEERESLRQSLRVRDGKRLQRRR